MIASFRKQLRPERMVTPPKPVKLLVCLPFYSGDEPLLIKNLEWYRELDGHLDFDCLLCTDTATDYSCALDMARTVFNSAVVFQYERQPRNDWPFPQNNMFTNVAWHMYHNHAGPWLLCETDATPLVQGWLSKLWNDFRRSGKPFGGHWSEQRQTFNGTAFYPSNVSQYAPKMMTAALSRDLKGGQPPWDVYGSKEVKPHLHVMNDLMQHVWQDDATGKAHTFPTQKSMKAAVRSGVVLFHRCKDGTLLDRARDRFRTKDMSKDLIKIP